jgi:hypothetical protein
MQTFLPFADFERSARALDQRRLGKQRVETLQVMRGLTIATHGWRHHPAVKMWAGYEKALTRYGLVMCEVWSATGRADTVADTLRAELAAACDITVVRSQESLEVAGELPPWLGREDLHRSHRAALLRKDPAHYGPLFGEAPTDIPYVWPPSDRPPSCGHTADMEFTATVILGGKTATGIEVPEDVVAALGRGKRPAVRVRIGAHAYRTTVAPMSGSYWIPLSAEHRTAAGVSAGEEVTVAIEPDDQPRTVEVPADLAAALDATPAAKAAFEVLSYSNQRRHTLSVEGAKTAETRQRRIDKVIAELTA